MSHWCCGHTYVFFFPLCGKMTKDRESGNGLLVLLLCWLVISPVWRGVNRPNPRNFASGECGEMKLMSVECVARALRCQSSELKLGPICVPIERYENADCFAFASENAVKTCY